MIITHGVSFKRSNEQRSTPFGILRVMGAIISLGCHPVEEYALDLSITGSRPHYIPPLEFIRNRSQQSCIDTQAV